VNARLGWEGEHFGAFLIVNNVFDVQKPSQFFIDFDNRTRGTLTEPRTIGLSFEGKFLGRPGLVGACPLLSPGRRDGDANAVGIPALSRYGTV